MDANASVNYYYDNSPEYCDYEYYHLLENDTQYHIYSYLVGMSWFFFVFVAFKIFHCFNNNDELYKYYHRYFNGDEEDDSDSDDETVEIKPAPKYEDKYLDKYRSMEVVALSEEKLNSLKNVIVMETTPHGNVIMFYNHARETFTYYSDNTIPYRYLEVVGRKYVIFNNCRCLFVDMDEELKRATEMLSKPEIEHETELEPKDDDIVLNQVVDKKNVFAKFKSYNTVSKSAIVPDIKKGSGAQQRTNNSSTVIGKDKGTMILKEKSNRYSCEGKLCNFSFLKKVDKKVVDKNYGYSFKDFKKNIISIL
jgi:hypothetical protein